MAGAADRNDIRRQIFQGASPLAVNINAPNPGYRVMLQKISGRVQHGAGGTDFICNVNFDGVAGGDSDFVSDNHTALQWAEVTADFGDDGTPLAANLGAGIVFTAVGSAGNSIKAVVTYYYQRTARLP